MADKYLAHSAGQFTEVEAKQTSAGAGDAGKIPALGTDGRLDNSMMPGGIGADTASVQASEALAAGDLVNIWNSAGAFRVRKADASSAGKEAHGFVKANVASGSNATVFFEGPNTGLTGLTPGIRYLSATTPGGTATAPPTAAGSVSQRVGFATSASEFNFEAFAPIVLA